MEKIIIPRIGKYKDKKVLLENNEVEIIDYVDDNMTEQALLSNDYREKRGYKFALIVGFIFVLFFIYSVIPGLPFSGLLLDMNEDKMTLIKDIAKAKGLDYCIWSREKHYSVEQWLRSFRDADFIITDSYHGLLFSLIFNKSFHLLRNQFRGNARFDSIAISLGVDLDKELQDYTKINQAIVEKREQSIRFLENSIQ